MTAWLAAGNIQYREDMVEGLERAAEAFIGLLRGENFGKVVVRVGPRATRAPNPRTTACH